MLILWFDTGVIRYKTNMQPNQDPATVPAPQPAPAPAAAPVAPTAATGQQVHVTGRRVLAILLDSIIVGIVFTLLGFKTTQEASTTNLIVYGVFFLYYVVMEWLVGATLGKLICGIRVRTVDGSKIGFVASLVRNLMRVVDGFPYFIPYLLGFIVILSGDSRQRLGDKVAHTVVAKA